MKTFNVAIVGGGPGCLAIMDMIFKDRFRQLQMHLVAVADINSQAPAMARARALNIYTTRDYRDLLDLPNLNLIIELTGDPQVSHRIALEKPSHVRFMDHTVARLFWDFIRLEEEKITSERKYKDLFDNAREGLVLFDGTGTILETNFSLALTLGYTKAALEQMKIFDLAKDFSRRILQEQLEGLRTLGFASVEMDFVKKNGDTIPVQADITWLLDENLFRMMVRDISLKKKLEESRRLYSERLEQEVAQRTAELKISEEDARRQKKTAEGIIYGSPIPMFVLDPNHKITYWNKACEKLTGFRSAEMIGTDRHWEPFYSHRRPLLADLILDRDLDRLQELYSHMNLRKSPFVEGGFEAEHFFSNLGEEGTHLYWNAAPIKDDENRMQGAVVTYQDFTDRVKITQELRKREAFVQNLIRNSIDGIIATDSQGKIAIFNRGAVQILGYSPEEMIGRRNYQDIMPQDTIDEVERAFYGDQYGPRGKIINMELALVNKDRQKIPVRLSGTLLYDRKSEVGSVVFIQDLREIHALQREKEQAQRMAAIGRTVAGLAHYIKNILNGLKGGAYVLKSAMEKKDMDLVGKGWRMVEGNIEQISSIVMDMLIYSSERKPQYQDVDPNKLALEIIEMMEERAKLSRVSLTQELQPDLEPVSMDRDAIHRCLLNLVTNAIDACTLEGIMDASGVVTVKTDQPSGWGVRFEVSDNGTGMTQETQERLFTDFFTTKGYKGTGLGLPVTEKIVSEHGGQLSFWTDLGRGTTFTILLPKEKPE